MKIVESFDITESFGMKDLLLDELIDIDAGCFGKNGCGIRIGCDKCGSYILISGPDTGSNKPVYC